LPKDTFLNLKAEKRQRIMKAALREIAAQGYDKASVTRIVKGAGIATGSFYQYFEDLADVFVYIGQEGARLKAQYMQRELENTKERSMEGFVRAIYRGGLRFGMEHEEYFRAAQSFLQIKDTEIYHRMFDGVQKSEIFVWLYKFVSQAIQRGELHDGITPELFLRLAAGINTTIIEYLIDAKPEREMSKDDLETLCELGVQILLHGVQKTDG